MFVKGHSSVPGLSGLMVWRWVLGENISHTLAGQGRLKDVTSDLLSLRHGMAGPCELSNQGSHQLFYVAALLRWWWRRGLHAQCRWLWQWPHRLLLPLKAPGGYAAFCVTVTGTCRGGHEVDNRKLQKPKNGECAGSVVGRGGRWDWWNQASRVANSRVCRPESAGGAPHSLGAGSTAGTPGVLSCPCKPASPPHGAVTIGRDSGQSWLGLQGTRVGTAVVWGCPVPPFSQGESFYSHFLKCLRSKISNPRPCPPSLALPRAGNKSLNLQMFPCIPKCHLPLCSS